METEAVTTILYEEQAAVKTIYNQLINSWNEMDAEAYADLFARDGSIVGFDGSQANGQNEVFDHLSKIFADHKPAKFVTIIREIRTLSSSAVLLRAVAGMVPRGEKDINPKTNAIQSMIVVKDHDKFEIALFQNTPAVFHGRTEESEDLTKELQDQLESIATD